MLVFRVAGNANVLMAETILRSPFPLALVFISAVPVPPPYLVFPNVVDVGARNDFDYRRKRVADAGSDFLVTEKKCQYGEMRRWREEEEGRKEEQAG